MKTLNQPTRGMEQSKQEEFELIKRRIHSKLVDKLDINRVGELKGETLRPRNQVSGGASGVTAKHAVESNGTRPNR